MIGAVIPAFNAESTVGKTASGVRAHVDRLLVVDDGSMDATSQCAAESGAQVIRHERNRGKGVALQTGFSWMLRRDVSAVITIDADLQHDPDEIPKLVERYQERLADLVIGSRQDSFESMTSARRIGNRFSSSALRFFTGLELPDSQSGFRLYSADFLRDLKLRRRAYDAEMEVLLQAVRSKRRIENVPARPLAVDGKATSNFRPWLDTYRICRTVVWFSVCEF